MSRDYGLHHEALAPVTIAGLDGLADLAPADSVDIPVAAGGVSPKLLPVEAVLVGTSGSTEYVHFYWKPDVDGSSPADSGNAIKVGACKMNNTTQVRAFFIVPVRTEHGRLMVVNRSGAPLGAGNVVSVGELWESHGPDHS